MAESHLDESNSLGSDFGDARQQVLGQRMLKVDLGYVVINTESDEAELDRELSEHLELEEATKKCPRRGNSGRKRPRKKQKAKNKQTEVDDANAADEDKEGGDDWPKVS